jgi:hypothetical protein
LVDQAPGSSGGAQTAARRPPLRPALPDAAGLPDLAKH